MNFLMLKQFFIFFKDVKFHAAAVAFGGALGALARCGVSLSVDNQILAVFICKGLGGGASRREFFPIFYKSFGEFYIVRMRGFSGAIPGGEIALYFGIFERFGRKPKIRFGNRQNI